MVSANRPVDPDNNNPSGSKTKKKKSVRERRLEKRRAARIEAHRQRANQDQTIIEFQPDAVEIEERSVAGGARWTLYISILFMCSAIAWSYWAQVDKIVTAQGQLVSIEPPAIIQASFAAPIHSINVKFGDIVKSGQVLATLDPTFPTADLESLRLQLASYDASIGRLRAEDNGVPFSIEGHEDDLDWMMQYKNYQERKNEFRARMTEFASEAQKLEVQSRNIDKSIDRLTKDYKTYRSMQAKTEELAKRGSASEVQRLSREIQSREAASNLVQAQGRAEELVAEKNALEKRKLAFVANWRAQAVAELIEHTQQRNGIEQSINKAQMMSKAVEIRVPENEKYDTFSVFEIADRSVGSVTKEGEPLFKLIPDKAPHQVEIEIQGKDIGLISVGSTVRVKLASFPYQKHGTLKGVIQRISEGSFEKQGAGGATSTHFKAIVELDDSVQLENMKKGIRMMPGMTTIAEIKVGRRRVLQYFLYPLLRYWDEVVREP